MMTSGGYAFLCEPYADWTCGRFLRYMHRRESVEYFPVVPDLAEISRAKMDAILDNRFEFNAEMHRLDDPVDWTFNPNADREWLILLHKFYYAPGLGIAYLETRDQRYLDKWIQLTDSWIASVPVEFLPSDVTGRRIQNWIYAHYYFVSKAGEPCISSEFYGRFLCSLHEQVTWLKEHLTPARNHRTLELCAILLAAVVFPEMQDAAGWLTFAVDELMKNMRSDLLPDGVHCELSTDYHHIVLRNLLAARRLLDANAIPVPAEMDAHIRRALNFAKWVHRPDGIIPSFSDGDNGSFVDLLECGYGLFRDEEMLYVATEGREGTAPHERLQAFPAGGYYIMRSGWGDKGCDYRDERYLIFDCGPLGAGNHGHFDALHFEAYAFGCPLIVDPGRYTYHESADTNWRALFRSTKYHNTATVDGGNQVRYEFNKGRFRVRGPEPTCNLLSFCAGDEIDYLRAECRSSEYNAIHERRIAFVKGEYWVISDVLSSAEAHDYDIWFHLSPDSRDCVRRYGSTVHAPCVVISKPDTSKATIELEEGWVSTKYGEKCAAPVVRLHQHGSRCVFHTVLIPYRGTTPEVSVKGAGERIEIGIEQDDVVCRDTLDFRGFKEPFFRRETMSVDRHKQRVASAR